MTEKDVCGSCVPTAALHARMQACMSGLHIGAQCANHYTHKQRDLKGMTLPNVDMESTFRKEL